nr:BTAD domain-containing putative transcriptional regulator [Roseibium hamelinense]
MGVPQLLTADGKPIPVKTRKAFAILVFILRAPARTVTRDLLADTFWSGAEREKAVQSLRQALRQIRVALEPAGADVLVTRSGTTSIQDIALSFDLEEIERCVGRGAAEDYDMAAELWLGEFLYGFEGIDSQFDAWLLVEREGIQAATVSKVLKQIEYAALPDNSAKVEAACRFLLKIDRANETAHRILIKLYLAQGHRERAVQQFQTCEKDLMTLLEVEPDDETRAILEETSYLPSTQKLGFPQTQLTRQTDYRPAQVEDEIRLPEIHLFSLMSRTPSDNSGRVLRDEIAAGLSAYRSFELYQAEYQDDRSGHDVMRVDGSELGSFLLRCREDDQQNKLYVQFEDRSNGRIVFNEIINFGAGFDEQIAVDTAVQVVSRVHSNVIERLRRKGGETPFAKWCQAESYLWQFAPTADAKALELLNEIERKNPQFSMTYAGYASIGMKQMLYYPSETRGTEKRLDEIYSAAEKAVNLDPWQPVNQRLHGWSLIHNGIADDSRRAFEQAARLNPRDPANLMSVAEGLAFVGDNSAARNYAEKAYNLFPTIPRVFYEYLANISFAAGHFEDAVLNMERAPSGSIYGLTTRIAALVCMGREAEARDVLEAYQTRFDELSGFQSIKTPDQMGWYQMINFFQNKKTRDNYRRGAEMVRAYLGN